MKCKVLSCLLCVLFCFSTFSLSSSAVSQEAQELPEDVTVARVYDSYTPSILSVNSPYYPNFDVKKLPWGTFPDHIKKYVYMAFNYNLNNLQVPFVMVRVAGSTASVYVGYNLGFGFDNVRSRYRVYGASTNYDSRCKSVCYSATFNSNTYTQKTDWTKLEPTLYGESGRQYLLLYSSTLAYGYSEYDFYFYGGTGVFYDDSSVGEFGLDCGMSGDIANLVYFMCNPSVGFQSGLFFPSDFSSCVFYGQYFVPPTLAEQQAAQQQQVIDGQNEIISQQDEMISQQDESNEKQQGIWDTLKDIPNMIAEKIKGLFVPEDGFFEEHINEYQDFFSEALGVIYELPETLLKIFNDFVSYNPQTDNYGIQIPEVVLPVKTENGKTEDLVIFEAQYYKFDFLNDGPFATLYEFYRAFVWLVILLSLINFSIKKFNELTTGD